MIKRLFYFTGYRISALHWSGKKLVGSSFFEPTTTGLKKFNAYLKQTENISSKFLVDVIEEDFRLEKIPHVGGRDKTAIIERLIDRYYRSSKNYCHYKVVDREKTGRKDDIVLLDALTNPPMIQAWLNVLEENKILLSGIWSLPLVSSKVLPALNATKGTVLLVTQQVNSNIRQSLFKNGILMTSRQSIVNQNINDTSNIGQLAAPDVRKTIDFLRAQNILQQDELLNVHIIASDTQINSIKKHFKNSEKQKIVIHTVDAVSHHLKLKNTGSEYANEIFSYLCLNQGYKASYFGEKKLFNRYHNKLASIALYTASLIVIMCALFIGEFNLLDAKEHKTAISLLKKEESTFKSLYAKKFKDFEGVFQNAAVMNAAVELAGTIKHNAQTSPLEFLVVLSEILNKERGLTIDKIKWQAVTQNEKSQKYEKADFTIVQEVEHQAIVDGRIDDPEYHYRESINHIQQIIDYLKNDSRIEKVEVITMPVDLRSQSKFSTMSGVEVKPKNKQDKTGHFSLSIIMKALAHD